MLIVEEVISGIIFASVDMTKPMEMLRLMEVGTAVSAKGEMS